MKVNVESVSAIERKLSIEVEAAVISAELTLAYTALSHRVKVPGFRPGKVPRRILEQRFKVQVHDDVAQRVAERAYLQAVADHKLPVVDSPRVSNPPIQVNAPFSFEVRVQVRPEVTPKDYAGLTLTRHEVKVDEAKVDEQLKRLQDANTKLEITAGRDAAQVGDFAVIDYTVSVEGKPLSNAAGEGTVVEVAAGDLLRGNIEALAGLKLGEQRDVSFTFPDDYAAEEAKGKAATFHCTLKELKHKVVPPLDDAFAKQVEGGETLEELKGRIRKDIEEGEKSRLAITEREELLQALVAKNAFEVPGAMVERGIDFMLRGALSSMMGRGMDPRTMNLDFGRLREELRAKAELEVRGSLLLEAIADVEKLTVSDEELETAAKARGITEASAKDGLRQRLREDKAVDFVKAKASY